MLIGKTRTNQPVEGYQDAPVFNGELEEKEGKISLDMDIKDAEYIYEHKPMVVGIRVPDEDEEGKFQIIYFTLAIDRKETDDAVMYQLIMTDNEEQTITKLSLAFLDDGDDIKVVFDEEELHTLPTPEYGDDGKVVAVNGDEDGYELVPLTAYTSMYKHFITIDDSDDNTYWFELIDNNSGTYDTFAKLANAMRLHEFSPSNIAHKVVYGYRNVTTHLGINAITINQGETKLCLSTGGLFSEVSYSVVSVTDVVIPL